MIDLSYTNKDGVNLYEGFDNGFDYHRDGAAEGDGYAHGGYPEITGETSDYTDTSYRTGDKVDFFDNGNVWEEVSPLEVESIAITKEPTKTEYTEGESLDLTGLEVTATYSGDGKKEVVTGYTATPAAGTALATTDTSVAITYASKAASFAITVASAVTLESIAITTPPTKTEYSVGDTLDLTGMVVTATYSDGNTATVTEYITSPDTSTPLTADILSFTVTYEGKTAEQAIQVASLHIDWYKVNGEKINSIEPTSETTCDFHQYIVETDLETNEEKIIHIEGSAEIHTDTEEPYSDVSVNSANYVTMSGSTITETLGTVSGISVTGTLDDSTGDIHLTTTYKELSLLDVINIDESHGIHR